CADGVVPPAGDAGRPGLPAPGGDYRLPSGLRRCGGIEGRPVGGAARALPDRRGAPWRQRDHRRRHQRHREPRGMSVGTVYGVGLGPGDPELMSVRADRLVRSATHVAYFRKAGRPGRARTIVEGMLREGAVEIPMEYPVTTEIPVD